MHDLLEVFQNFHGPWGPPKCKLFFLGWYFKTEFGWWQDLHKEDVKILAFVNFAINIKCRTLEKKI
jgi:hypothetical protein